MIERYRGFTIEHDPKPIPTRAHDYSFVHEDYDGPEDKRIGTGSSVQDCRDAIDDMLWEPECEACQGAGRVQSEERWSVDAGTKWQRNFVDAGFTDECPICLGKGTVAA